MSAPRREYDPKRRPNIFYKGDKASNEELRSRARDREQDDVTYNSSKYSLSEKVSSNLGFDMARNSRSGPRVSKDGKWISDIAIGDHAMGASVVGATSKNMPISGTALGKTKGLMQGKG